METEAELLAGEALLQRARSVLTVPINELLHVRLAVDDDTTRGVVAGVPEVAGNGAGGMHASALAAVMECAGLLALLPHLRVTEHAITHSVTLSLIGAVTLGAEVEASGEVDRRTRRLGFVSVLARSGGVVVARAQLVKSVVPFGVRRATTGT